MLPHVSLMAIYLKSTSLLRGVYPPINHQLGKSRRKILLNGLNRLRFQKMLIICRSCIGHWKKEIFLLVLKQYDQILRLFVHFKHRIYPRSPSSDAKNPWIKNLIQYLLKNYTYFLSRYSTSEVRFLGVNYFLFNVGLCRLLDSEVSFFFVLVGIRLKVTIP